MCICDWMRENVLVQINKKKKNLSFGSQQAYTVTHCRLAQRSSEMSVYVAVCMSVFDLYIFSNFLSF